jgi:hypothetical protein
MNRPHSNLLAPIFAAFAWQLFTATSTAQNAIAYQWLPGGNSAVVSAHSVVGPVLATDFIPSTGGPVVQIDWWGSAPMTGIANNDSFEVTFHTASPLGVPAVTPPTGGISQHFVTAPAVNTGTGVWLYSAAWAPMDVNLTAGTTYWFSVANASGGAWTWANPLLPSPETGGQSLNDVVSVGGPQAPVPGPHGGPWSAVFPNQNFAARIWVVPEPSAIVFVHCGIAALCFGKRRRLIA